MCDTSSTGLPVTTAYGRAVVELVTQARAYERARRAMAIAILRREEEGKEA
jgi:hypothetical protein